MEDVHKFRLVNKLKQVYRMSSLPGRKESAAEHSWACIVLADFLLPRISRKLDRLKVFELLLYHDVVEVYAGDVAVHPGVGSDGKQERELLAAKRLKEDLPKSINNKFFSLFEEFEKQESWEARFARAVDALEPVIHELDYKDDWKVWSEKFLREKKESYFRDFPELRELFEDIIVFVKENDYFKK